MQIVARRLEPLNVPFAFVGGAVICLLVDHAELSEIRPTKDVDVIVEILTYVELSALEERLRAAGFKHDTSEGAPICRWIVEGCRVDIMPIDSRELGMNSKWFQEALEFSNTVELGKDCTARVIAPALFVATKLEAFKDRGKDDYYGSHDLEDIITLVDGRASIIEDISSARADVRAFIASWFARMLKHPDFRETLPGHLSSMPGSRERAPAVMQRFEAVAALT